MVRFAPFGSGLCGGVVVGSGGESDVAQAVEWLARWLRYESRFDRGGERAVVVFDIDDTLVDPRDNKPLPAVQIYHLCAELGFDRAIVTARPNVRGNEAETVRMLHGLGIRDWTALHMLPAATYATFQHAPHAGRIGTRIAEYKHQARARIAQTGQIIANIGDMWTDLMVLPVRAQWEFLLRLPAHSCCVLFPTNDEVALKLPTVPSG